MSRFIFLASLLALIISADAAEKFNMLVVSGATYTNVTVTGYTATDIYFKHGGGIASARLRNLSLEIQKRFNYDPDAAERKEIEQAQRSATFGEVLAEGDMNERERKRLAEVSPPIETAVLDAIPGAGSVLDKSAPQLKPEKWLTEKPEADGKFQIIFIWSSTSAACKRSIPQLNGIAKNFHDKLVVTAISPEPAGTLEEFSQPKLEFASASDKKSKFAKDLGVTTIPCTVLIDPKGIVRYLGHPAALDDATLKALLAKFAEKE